MSTQQSGIITNIVKGTQIRIAFKPTNTMSL